MMKIAQPIKMLIVNLSLMQNYFRPNDSISKELFDSHFKQVQMLLDMCMIPKVRYNLQKALNESDVLTNQNKFAELIKLADKLAEEYCGVSEEDIDDTFANFYNSNKEHASKLYFINAAPLVSQAYDKFLEFKDLMCEAAGE